MKSSRKHRLKSVVAIGLAGITLFSGCANSSVPVQNTLSATKHDEAPTKMIASQHLLNATAPDIGGDIVDSKNRKIGTISGYATSRGVLIDLEVQGLQPGRHGMHFHENGICSPPSFLSAGPHLHDGNSVPIHGLRNLKGTDAGDLPNLTIEKDGTANVQLFSSFVRVNSSYGPGPYLLKPGGSTLVIHINPDDQLSQPIGGSGARVACAVIRPFPL